MKGERGAVSLKAGIAVGLMLYARRSQLLKTVGELALVGLEFFTVGLDTFGVAEEVNAKVAQIKASDPLIGMNRSATHEMIGARLLQAIDLVKPKLYEVDMDQLSVSPHDFSLRPFD